MIQGLRYLRGYVKIKIWGFAPERFMNLCSYKNILLWDIKREEDTYYMCISLSAFYQLRKIAKKTQTRVVILERYGLPFLLPKLWKRKIFLVGMCLACLFWILTSLFVWKIEVEGNYRITRDAFLKYLDSQGVHVGSKKADIDIEDLEKAIRRQFPDITWVSAKFDGTRLIFSVKENDVMSYPLVENACCDLYAEKDGVIVSMIVRKGTPLVKIGDSVEMGQMLVSGEIPVLNEDATIRKYQYTDADADIYVKRKQEIFEELPFTYVKKMYTGREKKEHRFAFFGKEVKFGEKVDFCYYDMIDEHGNVTPMEGLSLPLGFGSCTYREYLNVECVYSLEEAQTILEAQYQDYLKKLKEEGVKILSEEVYMDSVEDTWLYRGEIVVEEKIGTRIAR